MSNLITSLGTPQEPLDEFSYINSEFRSLRDVLAFYGNPNNSGVVWEQVANEPEIGPAEHRLMAATDNRDKYRRKDVFLWRYLMHLIDDWRPQYQRRGTCVGQMGKLTCDAIMAINSIFGGGRFEGRAAVATAYAGGRVDIGGQPGNWDGSTGRWNRDWLTRFGCVLLEELGFEDDSRDPDERQAVRWAGQREGVPGQFEEIARTRPIVEAPLVTDTDQAETILDAGGIVGQCSVLIATGQRNRLGVSPLRQQGGHAQTVWGKFYVDGRRHWNVQNSWSERWGSGPKYPRDMPDGSVNITDRDFQRVLNSRDCYGFVGIRGFDAIPDNELPDDSFIL